MAARTVFARAALGARLAPALGCVRPMAPATAAAPMARALHTSPINLELLTRYTKEHEWITYDTESNVGTIGITDHAQNTLGDTTYIDLPSLGTEFEAGESIGGVESVKAASDIYAPVSGVVEDLNNALSDDPRLINKSPEDKGWLLKVRLANPSEVGTLLNKETYDTLVQEESEA